MSTNEFRVVFDSSMKEKDQFILRPQETRFPFSGSGAVTVSGMPDMRVGDRLFVEGADHPLEVVSVFWLPEGAREASARAYLLRGSVAEAGEHACRLSQPDGFSLAWITLSDKGAAGKRVDESGPMIQDMIGESLVLKYGQGFVIPDELSQLKALLTDLALTQRFDLVLTTGGTGVGPRDITPEATSAVLEKRLPGFERAMTAASLLKTPHGAISRAVAGTLGETLIVNLPGSPKAVAECLEPLLPTFGHTLEKLKGDPSDCAALRK